MVECASPIGKTGEQRLENRLHQCFRQSYRSDTTGANLCRHQTQRSLPGISTAKVVTMFIYNITAQVDNAIAKDWLQWQKEIHIPEVLATVYFYDHRLYKLLEQDESVTQTYIVQFFALDLSDYEEYISTQAAALSEKSLRQWGNKVIAFRTLLTSV